MRFWLSELKSLNDGTFCDSVSMPIDLVGKLFLKYKVLRSSRFRSSILQDRLSDIGKIKTFEKEVNLNADKKRLWFEDLKNINGCKMIDSLPLSFNFFRK